MTTNSATPSRGGIGAESGPASTIRAVLFDLDGTLIDSIGLILASFRYATEQVLGSAVPDDVLLKDVGTPLWRQMADISPENADELVRVYREHNKAHHDEMVREYPGTRETLRELKALGYPVAVVTSKLNSMAGRGLRLFGLDEFVDFIVGADDVETHKPDPFPLFHAAGILDIPLTGCAYVGDSPHDMAAAVAGGAVSIAALWGPFERDVVLGPHPEYALETIGDLLRLLDGEANHFRLTHGDREMNG